MEEKQFSVSLEKENLVFSAAHFITFNGNVCEQLHGHNYRVKCRVVGPLDENGYVIDFIALRDQLMAIIATLDHRMLLPTEHDQIRVTAGQPNDDEVLVRFENKRWVFPQSDCVLLPVANTTAELLALHIGSTLIDSLNKTLANKPSVLEVSVDENRGQWATVSLNW
jgi:6-pyruvoyltetrahydropterin/6-carboxytetrahydropterin synthase